MVPEPCLKMFKALSNVLSACIGASLLDPDAAKSFRPELPIEGDGLPLGMEEIANVLRTWLRLDGEVSAAITVDPSIVLGAVSGCEPSAPLFPGTAMLDSAIGGTLRPNSTAAGAGLALRGLIPSSLRIASGLFAPWGENSTIGL